MIIKNLLEAKTRQTVMAEMSGSQITTCVFQTVKR